MCCAGKRLETEPYVLWLLGVNLGRNFLPALCMARIAQPVFFDSLGPHARRFSMVAFSDGKPGSTFPENALALQQRRKKQPPAQGRGLREELVGR
jgi:hypothetical protein